MKCECPEANPMCCNGNGYPVFRVTRDGQRFNVCSRCDLSGDEDKVQLADIDLGKAWESDPLGAFLLTRTEA